MSKFVFLAGFKLGNSFAVSLEVGGEVEELPIAKLVPISTRNNIQNNSIEILVKYNRNTVLK